MKANKSQQELKYEDAFAYFFHGNLKNKKNKKERQITIINAFSII